MTSVPSRQGAHLPQDSSARNSRVSVDNIDNVSAFIKDSDGARPENGLKRQGGIYHGIGYNSAGGAAYLNHLNLLGLARSSTSSLSGLPRTNS